MIGALRPALATTAASPKVTYTYSGAMWSDTLYRTGYFVRLLLRRTPRRAATQMTTAATSNPVGRANVRSCHAGCSATFARAAVAPLTSVAHLEALGH